MAHGVSLVSLSILAFSDPGLDSTIALFIKIEFIVDASLTVIINIWYCSASLQAVGMHGAFLIEIKPITSRSTFLKMWYFKVITD